MPHQPFYIVIADNVPILSAQPAFLFQGMLPS